MKKTFTIKIFKWKELLHEGDYQFETVKEATIYEMGLFEGFRLSGKEPTGMSCTEKKEKNI